MKHLGTLHGRGRLGLEEGAEIGQVTYEIDLYLDRAMRSANGQIQGEKGVLQKAFGAGSARLALADGRSIAIVLSDPDGGLTAEILVNDPSLFDDAETAARE